MKCIDIRDPGACAEAVDAIHADAIVVQLPTVFVLLAAPTSAGAAQLDRSKARVPGKNYGTAIGSMEAFLAQADAGQLPTGFASPADFERMTGSFIRLRFRDRNFQSATVRDGTHQGVLLSGVHRGLFRQIEASFADRPADALWGGANYAAPLCTSCNVSGDPDGSIVDRDRALAFARSRGVALVLTCEDRAEELGSYPILGYEKQRISVHRPGPRLAHFKRQVPVALRGW